jgi:hypothetical protein
MTLPLDFWVRVVLDIAVGMTILAWIELGRIWRWIYNIGKMTGMKSCDIAKDIRLEWGGEIGDKVGVRYAPPQNIIDGQARLEGADREED